ncbi:N-acetylmuramoyl-L-alanine amidase [Lactobacillus sp. YT155]|uniref:N-acetylmuramoyl-L-alanine amidase n=1 Tax=Lactobacillus sp. YT155 TaxID=3060955 RepID=UPI00265E85FA|nr:N-acetylmuramoyl-L-alanine amidase [Lactobacillus sp. YT155]MDO1605474.1 N-acetylmuramoyl-L-alanine amidase [Lactobacillus sp. YT155]
MKKNTHPILIFLAKYGVFLLIAVLLIISATTTVSLAKLSTVTVKSEVVNIRVGPGLSYNSFAKAKKGDKLTVVDKKKSWWQVRLSGDKVGWVASWLIKDNEISSNTNHYGIITESGANVYATDDDTSKVLGQLQSGKKVNIVYQEEGWNQIIYGQSVGWVLNANVKTTGKQAEALNKHHNTNPNSRNNTGHKLKEDNIKVVTTISGDTKLRGTASTSGDVLTILPADEKMTFLSQQGDWYKVKTKGGTTGWVASWLVTISDRTTPVKIKATRLAGSTIVLDPGHGGKDVGAESSNGKYHESTYTTKFINALKTKLEQAGANVILTRNSNKNVALGPRARMSNKKKADAFISIHFDSSDSKNSASGLTTYYYDKERDNKLATSISSSLKDLPLENRGTDFGDYYVLRENDRPSVLLELGYINSSDDLKQIRSKKYRAKVVDGIYNGLINYFK